MVWDRLTDGGKLMAKRGVARVRAVRKARCGGRCTEGGDGFGGGVWGEGEVSGCRGGALKGGAGLRSCCYAGGGGRGEGRNDE